MSLCVVAHIDKGKEFIKGEVNRVVNNLKKPYQNSSCGIQEMRGVSLVSGLHNLYIEY